MLSVDRIKNYIIIYSQLLLLPPLLLPLLPLSLPPLLLPLQVNVTKDAVEIAEDQLYTKSYRCVCVWMCVWMCVCVCVCNIIMWCNKYILIYRYHYHYYYYYYYYCHRDRDENKLNFKKKLISEGYNSSSDSDDSIQSVSLDADYTSSSGRFSGTTPINELLNYIQKITRLDIYYNTTGATLLQYFNYYTITTSLTDLEFLFKLTEIIGSVSISFYFIVLLINIHIGSDDGSCWKLYNYDDCMGYNYSPFNR